MGIFDKLFGNEKKPVKQPIFILSDANCPYCKIELQKRPQRKTQCKSCSNFIYVKIDPDKKGELIVTEEQAKEIDARWSDIYIKKRWIDELSTYGVTKTTFDQIKDELHKRFNREPILDDIVWSLFNKVLLEQMKLNDLHKLQMLYYTMAIYKAEQGKDFMQYLKQSAKQSILKEKNELIKGVEILANQACEVCKKNDGKKFTFNEALEQMPIPNEKCIDETVVKGFCRCLYVPIIK